MDEVVFMSEITAYLTATINNITFLLSANTNIIHAYTKYGEIARLELIPGNNGNRYIHFKCVSRRFEDKMIRVEPNKIPDNESR